MNGQAQQGYRDDRPVPDRYHPSVDPKLVGLQMSVATFFALMAVALATGLYYLGIASVVPIFAQGAVGRLLSWAFPRGVPALVTRLSWFVFAASFIYILIYCVIRMGIFS